MSIDSSERSNKDLDYYVRLPHTKVSTSAELVLIQRDISGGKIGKEEIDSIKEFRAMRQWYLDHPAALPGN